MLRILFLAANPIDSSPLRLAAEQRDIERKLESSEMRADIALTSVFAARPSDLLLQMNKIRPQILHFSGHGASSGEIILESETGEAKAVGPSALKALFESFRPQLQIVVLNSCYSADQADAFTEIVDAVIAMKDSIGDRAAIAFASAFYSALGFGRSVSEAFKQGRIAILLEGVPDADVPALLHRETSDPSKLTLETSPSLAFSADPNVPEHIRNLLQSGTRLVAVDTSNLSSGKSVFFELALRQSKTTYVVQANPRATVRATAEALAAALISAEARHNYEWELTKSAASKMEERLVPFHTLEMAGIRSGDKLYLLGNHKWPEWAPQMVRR
jgi:hypothetical protein